MKLLHVRLREIANNYGWFKAGKEEQVLQIDFANSLADEIERDYIPKAVDANGDVLNIYDQCLYEGDFAYVMGFCKDNGVFVFCKGVYCIIAGERLKRMDYRSTIEDTRKEPMDYYHSHMYNHIPDAVLEGFVKELTDYIDQQGKDE